MFTDVFDKLKLSPSCLKHLDDKLGFTWYTVDDTQKHILTEALGEEVLSWENIYLCKPRKPLEILNMNNLRNRNMSKYTNNMQLWNVSVDDIYDPAYSYEGSDISLQDVVIIKH